jgi:hypothetical protein
MGEDGNELPNEIVGSHDSQPASSGGFDSYRSVSDPNLMIIVAKEVVPPFRFKAGGWELFRPSIELGSAMKARIAEKGFFLIRVNQDQTGGTELTDLPLPLPSWEWRRRGSNGSAGHHDHYFRIRIDHLPRPIPASKCNEGEPIGAVEQVARKLTELKLKRASDPHYLIFIGIDRFGESFFAAFSTMGDPREFRARHDFSEVNRSRLTDRWFPFCPLAVSRETTVWRNAR